MSFWRVIAARVRGDVPAARLSPLRRAGNNIYDLLEQADDRRLQLEIQGNHPWDTGGALRAFLAGAWLAFVFYTLADQLLAAEEGSVPDGATFVRSDTLDLARPLFASAERELIRAEQARTNPRVMPGNQLPVDLPIRLGETRLSDSQLRGALAALRVIRSRADSQLDQLDHVKPSPSRRRRTKTSPWEIALCSARWTVRTICGSSSAATRRAS